MATYYEMAIKGDDKDMVPFVLGYKAGTGATGIHILAETGFHLKSLRERLKHRGEVQHIICEAGERRKFRAALKKGAERFGFEIVSEERIKRAYFSFKFNTPSRKVARAIKKALASLPTGAKVSGYAPKEMEDPSAVGTEVYSPAHDYEFRGKGMIEGDPSAVIETRRKLKDIEFMHAQEIKLDHA